MGLFTFLRALSLATSPDFYLLSQSSHFNFTQSVRSTVPKTTQEENKNKQLYENWLQQ